MGQIEINHTGSGGGIALSSDGTNLLLDGSAVGGGADLYTANESSPSAQPSATGTNSIAIGDGAISSGNSSFAGPKSRAAGTNSFAIGIGDNSASYGVIGGNTAIAMGNASKTNGSGALAIGGHLAAATDHYAVAIGQQATASSTNAIALQKSRASGTYSFAAQNQSTSYGATGAGSVAIGNAAYATGSNSVAIGQGTNATSTGSICLGQTSYSQATGTIALGTNVALSGTYSVGFGRDAYDNGVYGKFSFGRDPLSSQRDVGGGLFVLGCSTTDATATTLSTYGTTPSTSNQIVLKNKAALVFNGLIVGRQDFTDGTDTAAFKVQGVIRREANAGTTVLVNSNVDTIQKTVSTMACTVSADTTLGCLKIQVTGIAGHNIRWAGNISTAEIEYI